MMRIFLVLLLALIVFVPHDGFGGAAPKIRIGWHIDADEPVRTALNGVFDRAVRVDPRLTVSAEDPNYSIEVIVRAMPPSGGDAAYGISYLVFQKSGQIFEHILAGGKADPQLTERIARSAPFLFVINRHGLMVCRRDEVEETGRKIIAEAIRIFR